MSIADAVTAGTLSHRPTVSFELYPPRTPRGTEELWTTVEALVAARPDFVSVTYGASGSTRDTTRDLVRRLLAQTSVLPIAHLTCVGFSRTDVAQVIAEFLDEGVRSFLALRGDPPQGQPDWTPHPEGLHSSDDLVRLLREVEAARCEQSSRHALRGAVRPLTVAVAAFPTGNAFAGTTPAQEVQRLLEKERAGADFAITQLFYEARHYVDFVSAAREAGVTIPILAGILPTTDPVRLERVATLTGVHAPPALLARLASEQDPLARHRLGVRATADLANAVLDAGAPGLHVYTFNTHEAALDLLEGVHLGGGAPTAPDLASGPWVTAPHHHTTTA